MRAATKRATHRTSALARALDQSLDKVSEEPQEATSFTYDGRNLLTSIADGVGTHPAFTELGEDLVVTDRPADHDSPILP